MIFSFIHKLIILTILLVPNYSSAKSNDRYQTPDFVFPSDDSTTVKIPTSPGNSRLQANPSTISSEKCKEYYNLTANQRSNRRELITPYLSTKSPKRLFEEVRNVRGGTDVPRNKFPHVVALGKWSADGSFYFICGGSLISRIWILTAAHCTHGPNKMRVARLGINRLSDREGTNVTIKRTIRHSSYAPPKMYNDIALVQLTNAVSFTHSIKPACLDQEGINIPLAVGVCGWGATVFGGHYSDILQETVLETVNSYTCSEQHRNSIAVPNGIAASMICAGSPSDNWEKDTCQGDSGGPMHIRYSNLYHIYELIGITSFGKGCAFPNASGVYTKVSYYREWIENIVCPNDDPIVYPDSYDNSKLIY